MNTPQQYIMGRVDGEWCVFDCTSDEAHAHDCLLPVARRQNPNVTEWVVTNDVQSFPR